MGKEFLKEWIYVYVEQFYEDLQDLLELTPKKKDVKYQNESATSKYTRHTGIHFDIWQN